MGSLTPENLALSNSVLGTSFPEREATLPAVITVTEGGLNALLNAAREEGRPSSDDPVLARVREYAAQIVEWSSDLTKQEADQLSSDLFQLIALVAALSPQERKAGSIPGEPVSTPKSAAREAVSSGGWRPTERFKAWTAGMDVDGEHAGEFTAQVVFGNHADCVSFVREVCLGNAAPASGEGLGPASTTEADEGPGTPSEPLSTQEGGR